MRVIPTTIMITNPSPARLAWALDCLSAAQARLTPVREAVLKFLAVQNLPVTLAQISHGKTLAGQFDDATVYRTLVLFVELEIVRQIQLQGRQTHFLLNAPGECSTFLVCRCCGAITPVAHPPALHELEEHVAEAHGYRSVTHNLELYGVCPTCHEHTHHCAKPSKLTPGLRLRGRFVN
jgi:Fur family peroxide stress response transcriptional regulator